MSYGVVYDKASWHLENDFPADLDRVYAYTHSGYFFGWIIDNGFVDSDFLDDFEDDISRFQKREITARDLFVIFDGVLTSDMLNDTGNAFASTYFDFEHGQYLDDYDEVFCSELDSMYRVQDTFDNYMKLCNRIDERFHVWCSGQDA